MADFNWWSFLDPTALTYESYGKARDVMSPSSGFSYYAPGSAAQSAYWAQKRGTSPIASAAQQRLEAAKQLQAALRAQQSAAYAATAAQARSLAPPPPTDTFAPPSFDATEPSAADQSVVGGRSDAMNNPYLRGAYVLGAAANLQLKPPPRSAGFTVKSTTNGRTFTSFSVRKAKKYNPEQTRKNAEIAAKKAVQAGKSALDAIQKGKLASQKQQKPPPKGKSVMGWVLGATRGPRLGVAALKAMAQKTIDSGSKLKVTADKFQKSTIAFDAKKAADTAKAQRVSQMPRSMRAPQGGKRRTVMGATGGSFDVFGLLGITPGGYDVFGETPGSFEVGDIDYHVIGATPGSFQVGRLGTHMPAFGTHMPDFGVDDDDLLGAAEIDYQMIGDDSWMEIVGEGDLCVGVAEWSEIVGDARQFNYEVLGTAMANQIIGQDEPPADYTDTTSASGMPGPPDYGALAMMGLTAPPTIQDAVAIMTDEAERDPFPNGDDQTFWDCPTDDSLPIGAIIFNGSRPMTQDAQARGGVGNYSFYFGQLPGTVPKGGRGSGYSLHNDGWWLLLTGEQPSRDYSGGRNYDKTGAADSAMDFESQKNGWGPLIGNPYDWEKGLRFSPTGPSGPRWFWYFDMAPDWARHAVVQQRLNDLMVQYQAAVTAGQADYVNAQIQDQLDQKAAADESRKSAAQDAELARQQQVFDQQQAQEAARQEAQAQALAMQEQALAQQYAATSGKLEEAQAAYFAAHPEAMFTQMPAEGGGEEGGGGEGGEEPYYGEEEEAPPDWGDEEGF